MMALDVVHGAYWAVLVNLRLQVVKAWEGPEGDQQAKANQYSVGQRSICFRIVIFPRVCEHPRHDGSDKDAEDKEHASMAGGQPCAESQPEQLVEWKLRTPSDQEKNAPWYCEHDKCARVSRLQRLPLGYLAEAHRLMQQRVQRIEDLMDADRIQQQRNGRQAQRQHQHVAWARIPSNRRNRAGFKVEPCAEQQRSCDGQPEKKRSVAVHPDCEERREPEEPPRIPCPPEMQQQQLDDQQ